MASKKRREKDAMPLFKKEAEKKSDAWESSQMSWLFGWGPALGRLFTSTKKSGKPLTSVRGGARSGRSQTQCSHLDNKHTMMAGMDRDCMLCCGDGNKQVGRTAGGVVYIHG